MQGWRVNQPFDWFNRKFDDKFEMIETNCKKIFETFWKEIFGVWQLRYLASNIYISKTERDENFIPLSGNAISMNAINSLANWIILREPRTCTYKGYIFFLFYSFSFFSVARKKHEGGVQMPRRERILRAQNLLAVSCFFPNGAYWHSIEMGNFNLSS